MKKKFIIIFFLLIITSLCLIIHKSLIKTHEVNYSINNFQINEKLNINNKKQYYDFIINDNKKNKYIINISDDFNKQKKIIEDIKVFNEGKTSCIYPVFKDNKNNNIYCNYDNKQVSYTYLKQINNKDIDKIIDKLKKEKISNELWLEKSIKKKTLKKDFKEIEVYEDNLLEDYTFLIWRYKGLYLLNKNNLNVVDYLDSDHYDNKYSRVVGNYYVTLELDDFQFSKIYCFDLKKLKLKTINLKNKSSAKFYINGVIDDKLYITDVGLKKQYIVNPETGKIKILDSRKDEFITCNKGKSLEKDSKIFLENEVYFDEIKYDIKLDKLYKGIVSVKEFNNIYYLLNDRGYVYKINKEEVNHYEILFRLADIKEFIVKDNDIMVIANDTLYFYNDLVGLNPIAYNKEFKYNYKNIGNFLIIK